MATTQVSPDIPKPSFAKVKSISAPRLFRSFLHPNLFLTRCSQVAASVQKDIPPTSLSSVKTNGLPSTTAVIADGSSNFDSRRHAAAKSNGVAVIASSLNDLSLASKVPSLVVDGRCSIPEHQKSNLSKESGSDESQKCDSSSELGTKPQSLDGKSITSGTTFALDEKESLRPDDSASVKAAAEDDDTFSIRGSLVAGSRMSSDVALRTRAALSGDLADRRAVQIAMAASPHGILTPPSASSDRVPALSAATALSADGSPDVLNVIYRQAPDEKLLDALATPRDRYFLLRLEKDVIDFVQDSKYVVVVVAVPDDVCTLGATILLIHSTGNHTWTSPRPTPFAEC